MATPAAPAPEITARSSPSPRPVTLAALRSAARVTTAVPCWSSWKTGMSSASCSRRSISKQRGAEMSSRLIPPKAGASRTIVSTSSSVSVQSRQIGTASMPPNCLNSTALPSITGIAAAGPMSPRPSTAVPSVTTATVCDFQVYSLASSGFAAMAVHTSATPGVYARERSARSRSGTVAAISILPPRCSAKTGALGGEVGGVSGPARGSEAAVIMLRGSRLSVADGARGGIRVRAGRCGRRRRVTGHVVGIP